MNINDPQFAPRPPADTPIDMADACARWPVAYAECLARLEGRPAMHATTAIIEGQRCLCLWTPYPRDTRFETAGVAILPPELSEVRELVMEFAS